MSDLDGKSGIHPHLPLRPGGSGGQAGPLPSRERGLKALQILAAFAWLLPAGRVLAQDSPLEWSGSVKTYVYAVGSTPLSGNGGWIVDSPVRLRLLYRGSDAFSLEAADELSHQFQSGAAGAAAFSFPAPSSYRILDFTQPLAGPAAGNGERVFENLDRLDAAFHWGALDLTVGRQVVSFGAARVVNPTDVLAPFNIQTRDQENRSGVDAVRLRCAWSDFGGLDAGWVAGKDGKWGNSAAFLHPSFRVGGAQFSAIGMIFQENWLAGGDFQGSLGGAGVWAEGAWVKTRVPEGSYARLSAGADYQFNADWYGFVEYHFNGPGRDDPARYLDLSNPAAYGAGTVYLLGRNYLCPGFTFQADPLLTFQGQGLVNLGDGSFLALVSGEYNVAENWYLNLGASQPLGGGLSGGIPTSEFGLYPSYLFAAGRYYF